jgi:hypothetical protein
MMNAVMFYAEDVPRGAREKARIPIAAYFRRRILAKPMSEREVRVRGINVRSADMRVR